ncbi:precorrin-2 C(20)-methyltransferase [Prochlorococcus marinus]|uniref:precorrin-2 C(20)-methyltransferase n=1 Tax=Prochlorococcus marinus TaxID=1219 RepID=UPI0022B50D37|nr:precorrin-2 C(20)-methyltransferase [Prochlorococcus marinus]
MIFFRFLNKFFSTLFFKVRRHSQVPSLTFVGIGPGDPSLLTFAAVDAIKRSSLVAFPVARLEGRSIAREVVSNLIKHKKCLPILFPMVKEEDILKKSWKEGSEQLVKAVTDGEKVVLLCLGDPSLYATSAYIMMEIKRNYPHVPLKVIPGVTSFSAGAAFFKWPLALKDESLIVRTVPKYNQDFRQMLAKIDLSNSSLVLLKLGKKWEWVKTILEEEKLLESTLVVERIGFLDEKITIASQVDFEVSSYFSLLIIRREKTF